MSDETEVWFSPEDLKTQYSLSDSELERLLAELGDALVVHELPAGLTADLAGLLNEIAEWEAGRCVLSNLEQIDISVDSDCWFESDDAGIELLRTLVGLVTAPRCTSEPPLVSKPEQPAPTEGRTPR